MLYTFCTHVLIPRGSCFHRHATTSDDWLLHLLCAEQFMLNGLLCLDGFFVKVPDQSCATVVRQLSQLPSWSITSIEERLNPRSGPDLRRVRLARYLRSARGATDHTYNASVMAQLYTAAPSTSIQVVTCAGRTLHAIRVLTVSDFRLSGPRDGVENPLRR